MAQSEAPALDSRGDRRVRAGDGPERSQRDVVITMAPGDVGLFHALLESHAHLAHFTVLEPGTALLRLFYLPCRERALRETLELIAQDIPLRASWQAPGDTNQ